MIAVVSDRCTAVGWFQIIRMMPRSYVARCPVLACLRFQAAVSFKTTKTNQQAINYHTVEENSMPSWHLNMAYGTTIMASRCTTFTR